MPGSAMLDRRTFLQTAAMGSGALFLGCAPKKGSVSAAGDERVLDVVLDAALAKGATYADIRRVRQRIESISTREARVEGIGESDSVGFGIRVLKGGCWGFAATPDGTEGALLAALDKAIEIATANA